MTGQSSLANLVSSCLLHANCCKRKDTSLLQYPFPSRRKNRLNFVSQSQQSDYTVAGGGGITGRDALLLELITRDPHLASFVEIHTRRTRVSIKLRLQYDMRVRHRPVCHKMLSSTAAKKTQREGPFRRYFSQRTLVTIDVFVDVCSALHAPLSS